MEYQRNALQSYGQQNAAVCKINGKHLQQQTRAFNALCKFTTHTANAVARKATNIRQAHLETTDGACKALP
jgi:hypothetical protein